MKEENKQIYKIAPLFAHFNEDYILKPYGYHHILNELANEHLKESNQAVGTVLENKYAWVLVSLSFEVVKPIKNLENVFGRTWYSGRRGPFYRREYLITDKLGNHICKGASYSILMDLNKRTIYREKTLPFKGLKENKTYLIEANPRKRLNKDFKQLTTRKVFNSDLDPIGHVNNLKYHEYIYDTLTEEQIKNIDKVKRVELYFQKELQKNNSFAIKKITEDNISYFKIENTTKNERAFMLILHLTKD